MKIKLPIILLSELLVLKGDERNPQARFKQEHRCGDVIWGNNAGTSSRVPN